MSEKSAIKITLRWITETSTIRAEVQDCGQGPTPARSREIWRGNGRKGGIGINAVRSYVEGLGGLCGNDGSIFYFEISGGMTKSNFDMAPYSLMFVSKKAEALFRLEGHQPTTVWGVMFSSLPVCALLAMLIASIKPEQVEDLNMVLDHEVNVVAVMLYCAVAVTLASCQIYFSYLPKFQWWTRTLLCFIYILLDIFLSIRVISENRGNKITSPELKYLPGTTLMEFTVIVYAPLLNIPFCYQLATVLFFGVVGRVAITVSAFMDTGENTYPLVFARAMHLVVIASGAMYIWFLEKRRRHLYIEKFIKTDLRRDILILEKSSRAREKEVKREEARKAAHAVSGCFNTILIAAQKLEYELSKKNEKMDEDIIYCFEKVSEAKNNFILLQKKSSREHELKQRNNRKKNKMTERSSTEEQKMNMENHVLVAHKRRVSSDDIMLAMMGEAIDFGNGNEGNEGNEEEGLEVVQERLPEIEIELVNIDIADINDTNNTNNTNTNETNDVDDTKGSRSSTLSSISSASRETSTESNQTEPIREKVLFPKILVVDDNEFCCQFAASQVCEILGGNQKCHVDCVGTSTSTVLNYLLDESSVEYDLVLMDMSMPDETGRKMEQAGIWITRQYKLARNTSVTRFICLSGMGRDASVTKMCKDAGFSYPYALGKPFDLEEMRRVLENI